MQTFNYCVHFETIYLFLSKQMYAFLSGVIFEDFYFILVSFSINSLLVEMLNFLIINARSVCQ